jgi:hypothetical protein
MDSPSLKAVVVKLDSVPLNSGKYQMLMRLRGDDKLTVDTAAKALGLTQADFVRAVVVNGAREVLSQLGVHAPATRLLEPPQTSENDEASSVE